MIDNSLTILIKAVSIAALLNMGTTGIAIASEETQPSETKESEEQSNQEWMNSETTVAEDLLNPKQTNEELAAEIQQELDDDMEIITFYGTKPIGYFRRQAQLAELNFYKKFNDYVDVNKYRVVCRKERPLGSRVASTVCNPQYLLTRIARESNFARTAGAPLPSLEQMDRLLRTEKEEFAKYSEELVKKHPELFKTLIEFGKAKKAYDDMKAE